MPSGFGLNSWLAFGEEVTFGTAVARTKWLEILEESIEGKQNLISKPALAQVSQANRVQGKKDVAGSFSFQGMFEGMEKILKHGMGSVAAVSGGGPYTHNFSLAYALPAGLTIEVVRDAAAIGGTSAFLYEGCQINKLTLKQAIEDFVMVEAEIIGEDFSLVAPTATSFTTFNGIDWSMLTISTLSGTAVDVKAWELSIENGLAADRFKLGSRIRMGLGRAQTRKISGKLTCEFKQLTEYNYWVNQTTLLPLVLTYNNGLVGASNKQFTMSLPAVAIQSGPPKVGDQGVIMVELDFEAFRSSAQNDEMTAQLIGNLNVSQ